MQGLSSVLYFDNIMKQEIPFAIGDVVKYRGKTYGVKSHGILSGYDAIEIIKLTNHKQEIGRPKIITSVDFDKLELIEKHEPSPTP